MRSGTIAKVRTKQELKDALKNDVDNIYIDQSLRKELDAAIKVMQMSPAKIAAVITFIVGGGAAIIAAIVASPGTMGIPALITAPALIAFSVSQGISVVIIAGVLFLAAILGTSLLTKLLKSYEYEKDTEFEFEGFGFRFRRKTTYK